MASDWSLGLLLAASLAWSQTTDRTDRDGRSQAPGSVGTRDGALPSVAKRPVDTEPAVEVSPAIPATTTREKEEEYLPFTNFRLGAEDLVVVSVLDSPEFSRSVRVNAAGVIRLPLVKQSIPASGKTTAELEQVIARVLVEEGLLRQPTVSVTVKEFHSKPVTVTGAVRSPTVFQALRPVRLSEALARAGGVSDTAGPDILIAVPSRDGLPSQELRVSVHGVLNSNDSGANPLLLGGEEVRVMPAGRVFIIGGVLRPGPVLLSDDRPLSLLQAVSMAGGPTLTAGRKAYLLRGSETDPQRQEIAFDLKKVMKDQERNLVLKPNDIIFVPDSQLRRATQGSMTAALTSFLYTLGGVLLWR